MVVEISFFFQKLSSLFAYKYFHQFFKNIFDQIFSSVLHTVLRFGALSGVSILQDKGHARNELWDVVYQMQCDQIW
jgi:hypothetical protein